jgi:hypothetical protein
LENPIITFRSYHTVTSAYVAKAKLDSQWIPSFLENENMCSLKPYDQVTGGVNLKIFLEDYEKVADLLPDETENPPCPACDSSKVVVTDTGLTYTQVVKNLLFSIFPADNPTLYQCTACGNSFRNSNQ